MKKKYADVCYGDGSQFYTGGLWKVPLPRALLRC